MNISSIQAAERPLAAAQQQPAAPEAKTETAAYTYKPYYYSPALAIDPKTGAAIVEIRNSSTGAVTSQYPSEKDLKAYSEKSLKPEVAANTDHAAATGDAKAAETVKPAIAAATQQPEAAATEPAPATPQASASILA